MRMYVRIGWTMGWLIALVLLLPNVDSPRPSRLIMPMLIGMPLIAVIPWVPTRFSLRTLLIATTLVAVGLGAIVALS
jgi:hypothetical protein